MDDEEGCDCDPGAPAWMATFSDLATLLLTFFVLLLSFAQMDVQEFREVLGSVREAFGVQFVTRGRFEAMSTTPVELNREPTSPLAAMRHDEAAALHRMQQEIESRGLEESVEVLSTDRGIVIRIRDRVLFSTGSASLSQDALPVLARVAELANVFTEGITIEGHTDDRPIHTSRFPSNWELSAVRAASVLRFLLDETSIDPGRVSIAGYADRRPVSTDDDDEGRARNRRVEFIFERPDRLQPLQEARDTPPGRAAEPDEDAGVLASDDAGAPTSGAPGDGGEGVLDDGVLDDGGALDVTDAGALDTDRDAGERAAQDAGLLGVDETADAAGGE